MAQRVISLAPSLTESVCALGLCENLVGVTDHCAFPAEVSDKQRIGGYLQPNFEKILTLKPDLVLALPEHRDMVKKMVQLGLKVETLPNYHLKDIHQTLLDIGRYTQREAAAAALVDKLEAARKSWVRRYDKPPKVLMVLGHGEDAQPVNELYAVGRKGFLHEILLLAGGENAVPEGQPFFPKYGREALIAMNPDVIIELIPQVSLAESQHRQRLKHWQELDLLKAVKQQQVFFIAKDHILQAGPRYIETLSKVATLLENL